jgi:hypothetical protein
MNESEQFRVCDEWHSGKLLTILACGFGCHSFNIVKIWGNWAVLLDATLFTRLIGCETRIMTTIRMQSSTPQTRNMSKDCGVEVVLLSDDMKTQI